jgi:uncharacterized LabA/DUF88 family protein
MDKAVVLLDGGYIDALNRDIFGRKRINYQRLSEELCEPDCVRFRTYYYNCPPYQNDPPTPDQRQRKASYDRFIHRLRRRPRFIVREGILRLISRIPFDVEQKGVDVLFACDLVRLAARNVIQKAIIVAGDSDYVPAVNIAKEEMVITELVYVPGRCSPHLYNICDERRRLTQALIDSVSF